MDDTLARFIRIMEDVKKMQYTPNPNAALSRSENTMIYFIHCLEKKHAEVLTSTLSQQLEISKSATSQTLNALEEKNLILRSNAKADRRLTTVTLTEEGHKVLQNDMERRLKITGVILERMGAEEGEQLITLLEKFMVIIKDYKEEQA